MTSFRCPRCQGGLAFERYGKLRWWSCGMGHGRAMALSTLRRVAKKDRFQALWTAAHGASPGAVACPSCTQAMNVVDSTLGYRTVEIDHCGPCQMLWFDDGEVEAVAGGPLQLTEDDARAGTTSPLPDTADAKTKAQATPSLERNADFPSEGLNNLQAFAAFVGAPVEEGTPPRRVLPLLSWTTGWFMILGGVYALIQGAEVWELVGFDGHDPLRGSGLPALASLVVDPRPVMTLLNAFVMFTMADNVEDILGRPGWVLMVVGATLAGWVTHALLWTVPGQPMTGATAIAAAMATFYALRFPQARFGFYHFTRQRNLGFGLGERMWSFFSARALTGTWLIAAAIVPWWTESATPNSWLEVFVGAAVGAAMWAAFGREPVLNHPDAQPEP